MISKERNFIRKRNRKKNITDTFSLYRSLTIPVVYESNFGSAESKKEKFSSKDISSIHRSSCSPFVENISLTKSCIFARLSRRKAPLEDRISLRKTVVVAVVGFLVCRAGTRPTSRRFSCHFPSWLLYYWHGALNLVGARRPCSSKPPLLGSRVVAGYNTLCLPKAVSGHLVLAR